jgi:hypothetical protein
MVDERANKASAGPAQRQRRPRTGGPVAAAARAADKPDLDARERQISPKRKAMGPTEPPEDARRVGVAGARRGPPDEPPTELD